MSVRRLLAALFCAMLVFCSVPASAIAEVTEMERATALTVEYRVAVEGEWKSFSTASEALEATKPDSEDQQAGEGQEPDVQSVALTHLELKLSAGDNAIEVSTRAKDEEWAGEWASRAADATDPFVDLKIRLNDQAQADEQGNDGITTTHDVWYRVHANGAWLDWVSNGDPAAPASNAEVDDVQVLLLTKEESEAFRQQLEAMAQPAEEQAVELGDLSSEPEETPIVEAPAGVTAEESVVSAQPEAVTAVPTVTYRVHAQTYGWMGAVANGAQAGTTGQAKRLEAINVSLPQGVDGGISYQVHAQTYGWMGAVANGAQAGTTGQAKRLEAIKIWLTGNLSNTFDVWYRVHAQTYGWMGWAKNGAQAGTTGQAKRLEAIQIILVPKGGSAPTSAGSVVGANGATGTVSYRAYSEGFGWMGWMQDGDKAGTTGIAARLEGFTASLTGSGVSNAELHYSVHMQTYGWQSEVTGGNTAGLPGQGKRLEAIKMHLTGNAAANFDIYYRCHIQSYGWLNWAKNGAEAGSTGLAKRVEAIQVVLVPKNGAAPANDSGRSQACIFMPNLQYRTHVQTYGWQGWVNNGAQAGTTGQAKRMEALIAQITNAGMSGEVQVNTHVQTYGWRGWVSQGQIAGTTGLAKRMEAVQIRLTGDLEKNYDVWYRVHSQTYGWLGWAKNGGSAGTEGLAKRMEAIQIKLVPKGDAAPGSTNRPFVKAQPAKTGYQNPSGYYQVSSRSVPVPNGATYPFNYITPSRIAVNASRQDCINAFVQRAREYLGTGYAWNYACAPGVGVDCIGLVYQCAYATGMNMGTGTGNDDFNPWAHWVTGASGWHSHDANNFWSYGKALHVPLGSRQVGDCISYPGHIGIYVGGDQVIEAYPGVGVVQRSMYASDTPRGCIRLFQ